MTIYLVLSLAMSMEILMYSRWDKIQGRILLFSCGEHYINIYEYFLTENLLQYLGL